MRLVVPDTAGVIVPMDNDPEEDRDSFSSNTVERVVANLPENHPLQQQFRHIEACVQNCAKTLNQVLQFDEDSHKAVFGKLDFLWQYIQEFGQFCQKNFNSTTMDLQNLHQGFDAFLRNTLVQNFQQVQETLQTAESRNNAKFSHLQQNLQQLFTQLENFSYTMQEMQSRLQQRDKAPTGAELGSYVSYEHFSTLSNVVQQSQERILRLGDENASFHQNFAQIRENYVQRAFAQQLEERIARLEQTSCKCGEVSHNLTTLHTQVAEIAHRQDFLHEKWQNDIQKLETASNALQTATAELQSRDAVILSLQTANAEL
eukprot:EG_transcript_19824